MELRVIQHPPELLNQLASHYVLQLNVKFVDVVKRAPQTILAKHCVIKTEHMTRDTITSPHPFIKPQVITCKEKYSVAEAKSLQAGI